MARLRIHCLSMSLDGFVAGPDQTVEQPLGTDGESLHEWIFSSESGAAMMGASDGSSGVDDRLVAAGFEGIGAWIMGRNMFGPIRDEWGESDWSGWWSDDPPYHNDVFVLTHHPRDGRGERPFPDDWSAERYSRRVEVGESGVAHFIFERPSTT